jgi:hypothetical protein
MQEVLTHQNNKGKMPAYDIRFVCLFDWVYVTPTQYRSFGDIPALLKEEDHRCPSLHYFRHERAPE